MGKMKVYECATLKRAPRSQMQVVSPPIMFLFTFYLLETGVQEKLGVMNKGVVYALWDYEAQNNDELSFHEGDAITILRRKDDNETEWWWARLNDKEGYVPKNLLGVSAFRLFLPFPFTSEVGD